MKRIFRNSWLVIILLLVISVILSFLAVYQWFAGDTISYYWDANLPMDVKISLKGFLYPWFDNKFPGYSGNGWSWLPYWLAISGFKTIFHSLSKAQFSLYAVLLVASIVGFFSLIRVLRETIFDKSNSIIITYVIPFTLAICFTFNLYTFYYAYYMFNPQMFTIAFLPWNFLCLFRLFPLENSSRITKKKSLFWWVALYVLTELLMVPGFTTYIFLGQYFLFLGLYFLIYWIASRKHLFHREILSFILLILATILFHWAWFYPSLLSFSNLYESQKSFGVMEYLAPGSINTHLLNLFRLTGSAMMNNNRFSWDWVYTSQSIVTLPLFIFPFSIVFVCLKLKQISRRAVILFLLVVMLVSLFIMKLANPPLADLTKFLFAYIPYFGVFRDSVQKAGLYFLLSYFLLIGFGLEILYAAIRRKLISVIATAGILILGVALMTGPFFLFRKDNIKEIEYFYQGKKYTLRAKTIIPKEYDDLKNFLEPVCKGNTVLVVPRTSALSSAVWEKYNYSYVGQDYLLNLIDCNFISTHLIQNDPDSFITSPYDMLQDNDFENFKKFLYQNQIGFVLIRHDYVPYYFTHWLNVDPDLVRGFVDTDEAFVKQYENDYFTLYQVKDVGNRHGYGFSVGQSMTYTNSPLKTAKDYAGLFTILPHPFRSVIINTNEQMKKYGQYVNSYIAKSNCVGCVKVLPEETQIIDEQTWFSRMKRMIKEVIKSNEKGETEDVQISMELIDSNYMFSDLMQGLDYFNEKNTKQNTVIYTDMLQRLFDRMRSYQGDFFSKNNKLIEIRNFLTGQNNRLTQFIRQNVEQISKLGIDQVYYVALLQKEIIDYVDRNVWETDLTSSTYNMRLDIPKEDEYTCNLYAGQGFRITDISLDGAYIPFKRIGRNGEIKTSFKQGSYPVSITYERDKVNPVRKQLNGNGTVFELGQLSNAGYSMKMDLASKTPSTVLLFISDGLMEETVISKIIHGENIEEQIIFFQVINASQEIRKIRTGFSLDNLELKEYYVYVLPLNQMESGELTVENFFVQQMVREHDITALCLSSFPDKTTESVMPEVEQINHELYRVRIPQKTEVQFLSFNQSYDSDWKAYVLENGTKRYFEHIKSGYSNAWVIDAVHTDTVYVEFDRLRRMVLNLSISLAVTAVFIIGTCALYYGYNRSRKTN